MSHGFSPVLLIKEFIQVVHDSPLQDKHGNTGKAEEASEGSLGGSSTGSDLNGLGASRLGSVAPGGVAAVSWCLLVILISRQLEMERSLPVVLAGWAVTTMVWVAL